MDDRLQLTKREFQRSGSGLKILMLSEGSYSDYAIKGLFLVPPAEIKAIEKRLDQLRQSTDEALAKIAAEARGPNNENPTRLDDWNWTAELTARRQRVVLEKTRARKAIVDEIRSRFEEIEYTELFEDYP